MRALAIEFFFHNLNRMYGLAERRWVNGWREECVESAKKIREF